MFESLFAWNGFDSSILGELSVLDRSRLEDPSTLSLAFTCLGTLAIFFAVRRAVKMVWPVQRHVLVASHLNDRQIDEGAADGSSRGAA